MGGEPVSATVTYDGTANQAKVVLREPLQPNTAYGVVVRSAVQVLVGNPLDAEVTWTFIVGSPGARIHLPLILRNG